MILFPLIIDIRVKYSTNLKKTAITKFFITLWRRIQRPVLITLILSIYQILVMFLRNITYIETYSTLYKFLLNFDYTILLLATYFLFLKRGTSVELQSVFDLSLPKLLDEFPSVEDIEIKLSNIKKNYVKWKAKSKFKKTVDIIYIILYMISELFNLGLIVLVASLNHALIECLFVITSFLISKKVFGAFHFSSAWKCWVVSNLSFFILNKITINAGITITVPILCGITLSYITSRFIKKTNIAPYRGISKEELKKICKDKGLTKIEYDILEDFYCERYTIIKLTHIHNYCRAAIFKYKGSALKKLES